MDPAAIREKYGVEPPQLIDVKSLMGDSSDNIPGVPGIGEKTALALVAKFGTLENIYANLEDKAIKPGQRAKLSANRDKADLSYMLGTIRKDAPIETDPAAYIRQSGDPAAPPSCWPRWKCIRWWTAGVWRRAAPLPPPWTLFRRKK